MYRRLWRLNEKKVVRRGDTKVSSRHGCECDSSPSVTPRNHPDLFIGTAFGEAANGDKEIYEVLRFKLESLALISLRTFNLSSLLVYLFQS
jgi:hypothetical protein